MPSEVNFLTELYAKSDLEKIKETLPDWQMDSFNYLNKKIGDKENKFPCIPGRQAFLSDQLRIAFVGDPRSPETAKELAPLLTRYGAISRETGKYASLTVIFHTPEELLTDYKIEDYESLFWQFLNSLSMEDPASWPDDIPENPEHFQWEYCFNGEPYFVLCATPAHSKRKSRSFPYFMLTFQPRWVFEELNDTTAFGRNMSKQIRKRLEAYDEVPIHPHLGWYGKKDNLEWKQYFLRDDENQVSQCPFMKMKNIFKKKRSD